MSNWTNGYVSGIDYTYGYYPDFNVQQMKLKLLFAGIRVPNFENACELGFGQGVSLLVNSASDGLNWYGTDFNPDQVVFAKNAAKSAGIEVNLFDDGFAEFLDRSDLPNFDFIALHGIWSWISNQNRKIITDFIKKKLNVGGVVYISYNCAPGRTSMTPVRELLKLHADTSSQNVSDIRSQITNSLDFVRNFFSTNPTFLTANPQVAQRVEKMVDQQTEYLAHEYFNKDWETMSFSEVSDILEDCKLKYVASADPIDAIPQINFSKEQLEIIKGIKDIRLRQVIMDFCSNRGFRKDYWVKGGEILTAQERFEEILALNVILNKDPEVIELTVQAGLGEAKLSSEVYEPILKYLGNSDSVKVGQLAENLKSIVSETQIIEALMILAGKGDLLISKPKSDQKAKNNCAGLNNFFVSRAAKSSGSKQASHLVSPLTTTAVVVSHVDQLFMMALKKKLKSSDDLAKFALKHLKSRGQWLVREGKKIENDEESLSEMLQLSNLFIEKKLPLLKKLEISI